MFKLNKEKNGALEVVFSGDYKAFSNDQLKQALTSIDSLLKSEGISLVDYNYLSIQYDEINKFIELRNLGDETVALNKKFGISSKAKDYKNVTENINFGEALQCLNEDEFLSDISSS